MQFLHGVVLWVPRLLKDFRKLTLIEYYFLTLGTKYFLKIVLLKLADWCGIIKNNQLTTLQCRDPFVFCWWRMVERRDIAVPIMLFYFSLLYNSLPFFGSYSFAKYHPPTSGRQGQVKDIFRCLNFLICLSLTGCWIFSTNLEGCLSKKTRESGPWHWTNIYYVQEAHELMPTEATLGIRSSSWVSARERISSGY